ncbi:MAG: rRNA maturation RNase YbeY [Treponema sp.]|jgi:probable rRNA maturation factor|nr:rRNA maturation RNase YbeY [Treponema sp.]
MNRVDVRAEEVPLPLWAENSGGFVLKVLDKLDRKNWDLAVLYCGDPFIRELNARYRGRDEATDILSFPQGPDFPEPPRGKGRHAAGDLVISLDTLAENARYFGVSMDEELRRLLIHGILHLDGMDHEGNEKSEPMLRLQEEILAGLAEERIII